MALEDMRHRQSVDIAAAPETVYAMVADLTRMGEWSPENTGGTWLSGDPGTVGAVFEGHNKLGEREWSTQCEITVADPGNCIEWTVNGHVEGGPFIRWRYDVEPGAEAGTSKLTETWKTEVMPPTMADSPEELLAKRTAMIIAGIDATLNAVKAAAEA